MNRLGLISRIICITLYVIGCSPIQQSTLDEVRLVSQSQFAVAIFDVSGSQKLYIGAPAGVQNVNVCVVDMSKNCIPAQTYFGRQISVKDTRVIFKIEDQIAFQHNQQFLVQGTQLNGTVLSGGFMLVNAAGEDSSQPPGSLTWKTVLMASDQGNQSAWISAFDNARVKLKEIFLGRGVSTENIKELSLHPNKQSATVKKTSLSGLNQALQSLQPSGANSACLIHMTSHGSPDGFNMGYERLSPRQLDKILESNCGNNPTVVLVSACYSGLYTLDQSGVKKPNRIILTAARHDRTSFGCSAEARYTFWDGCLIDELSKDSTSTWSQLANNIESCISRKESGMAAPSFPQKFIGDQVKNLKLPGK